MVSITSGKVLTVYHDFLQEVTWDNIPPFVDGSTPDKVLQFICKFGSKQSTLFEFGTFIGRSTKVFSQNFESVASIDFRENSDIPYDYQESGKFVKSIENVELIYADSLTFNFLPFAEEFDVVYVDGNHSEIGATSDFNNAVAICKKGGVIFIDDATNKTMGVFPALKKFPAKDKYLIVDLNIGMLLK